MISIRLHQLISFWVFQLDVSIFVLRSLLVYESLNIRTFVTKGHIIIYKSLTKVKVLIEKFHLDE